MRRIIYALVLVPLALAIKTQIPDIRRYLRIKAM
jgi:hypothetical protein